MPFECSVVRGTHVLHTGAQSIYSTRCAWFAEFDQHDHGSCKMPSVAATITVNGSYGGWFAWNNVPEPNVLSQNGLANVLNNCSRDSWLPLMHWLCVCVRAFVLIRWDLRDDVAHWICYAKHTWP